ncbi:MAG: DUF4395 domain-containing protein [Desulfuromonadaceae bacterium]|jgi:hypothetical protein|nr:DUF4395 domain-containing protein [Desulfuromonas sp.]MDY0184298.1 DUF4395 domain-containing protein [Desulfuromonadaceae bacterium]
MPQVCPISFHQVNSKAAQVNAAFTVVCAGLFLFTGAKWIMLLLATDFFIRGFWKPSYSLFNLAGEVILRLGRVTPVLTNAGPKLFAAKIGFVFSVLISVGWLSGFDVVAAVFAATLALFAALEAGFNFCVACKVYPLLQRSINARF